LEFLKEVSGKQLNSKVLKKINDAIRNSSAIQPNGKIKYNNTCSVTQPKDNCITYAKSLKFLKKSNYNGENCLILIPQDFKQNQEFINYQKKFHNAIFIYVDNPLMEFLDIHDYFHSHKLPHQWLHKPKDMGHGIYLGENVEIGENTVTYPGTVIYDNVKIGNNCIIHSNCSIGADGFRFLRMDDGTLRKMIHIANPGVIIEDDVEIFCNTNIARGIFDPTLIGKGTKVDALVHVAHNVHTGENNLIIADTALGGSVKIGENNWIGVGSTISNGVIIGNNNWIGLGAKVAYDVGDNQRISGFYAVAHKNWKRWWKGQFGD